MADDGELTGEVISPARVITLDGTEFRVSEKVGLMPLLKFSHAANLRTDDERAYAALYEILRDVICEGEKPCGDCPGCTSDGDCAVADPGDWGKFQQHAVDCKADADQLLDVVSQAIKVIAEPKPKRPPGGKGKRAISP